MLPELDNVIQYIADLPGIGRKSAQRIAFHLLKQSPEFLEDFTTAIKEFHTTIEYCVTCGALKSIRASCSFCDNPKRDHSLCCVLEQPSDIFSVENSNEYNGVYHILMGALSPLDGIHPEDLHLSELQKRLKEDDRIKELIIATNPSIEGNATAHYISKMAKNREDIICTRIATGLAIGSQIDFADSMVISQSIKARVRI